MSFRTEGYNIRFQSDEQFVGYSVSDPYKHTPRCGANSLNYPVSPTGPVLPMEQVDDNLGWCIYGPQWRPGDSVLIQAPGMMITDIEIVMINTQAPDGTQLASGISHRRHMWCGQLPDGTAELLDSPEVAPLMRWVSDSKTRGGEAVDYLPQ